MDYLYFSLICLLFGSNFMLMDRAAQVLGPATVGLGRLWSGAVVVLVVLWMSKQRLKVDVKTFGKIAVVALLSNAYPFAIQPWILQNGTDHSFLAVFVPLTPLLTIVASLPMLGVRPTWQQSVGVLGGLALLLWISSDAEKHHLDLWLLPIVVTVPLSYAIGNTFLRRNLHDVPAVVVSSNLLILAGLLLLPFAISEIVTSPPVATTAEWTSALVALAILGTLGTGACIGLIVHLVQTRGPLFAGMVTYVVPLIALAWGYRDGEHISAAQLIGIAGILAMVALVQSSQPSYTAKPMRE